MSFYIHLPLNIGLLHVCYEYYQDSDAVLLHCLFSTEIIIIFRALDLVFQHK
jgi:hypothetical protein